MKFSIIIPTHNRCDLLKSSVLSVLNQNFKDFEIIVVDDGGSDDTEQMLSEFDDDRIKYHWKKNEERSIARNFGILRATGDYINFLDSDDHQLVNHLEKANELIIRNEFGEVYHLGYVIKDTEGNTLLEREIESLSRAEICRDNVLHCNAIFIRKDIAEKNLFINSPYAMLGEDWFLWIKLIFRYKIVFDKTITSVVVEHENRSLNQIEPGVLEKSVFAIVEALHNEEDLWKTNRKYLEIYCSQQYKFLSLILSSAGGHAKKALKYGIIAFNYNWKFAMSIQFFVIIRNLFFNVIRKRPEI
ncbi:MAG: glycosyltransferase family 2 protein [Cyclobacteriaceae bacterium]